MNVFEDLVVELQEENLLETTFIDTARSESAVSDDLNVAALPNPDLESLSAKHEEVDWSQSESGVEIDPIGPVNDAVAIDETESESEQVQLMSIGEQAAEVAAENAPVPSKPRNGKEFYKKRAIGEISNLQMVEHVLTGVEREYMKIVPRTFDDFNAKKALNTFLQVTENENSSSHTEAEFALMNETEAWCSALEKRDREIQVSSLRQYCENSRPALSSQALLALARFYRNLPCSEAVRSKFDFVITRLFSRPTDHERRVCLFTREEMLGHINTLYREWSSLALYSADDNETNVMLTALSFDDLAAEAEKAVNFDQLISSDFFGRLRLFKESISELFFAPQVTAAAIDANVRIGNAYVLLIDRERQKMDSESIQSKYGDLHDGAVSDAAARTLDLVELLKEPARPVEPETNGSTPFEYEFDEQPHPEADAVKPSPAESRQLPPFVARMLANATSVNRWFLALSILLILGSVGVYVWANYFVKDEVSTAGVKVMDVDNSPIKSYAKTGRASGDNCYVLMLPVWDNTPKEKRQEVLQNAYKLARENGCVQVSLMSKDGKTSGFASATRLDVTNP